LPYASTTARTENTGATTISKSIKIGVIGAGSAQFSLGLVRDLCLTPSLAGTTVSLMDIDVERAEMVRDLAERYVKEIGGDLRFEVAQTREDAISEADFVINSASTGAHGARSFAQIHDLRFYVEVARDIERISPDAWLIQISNPVFEGTTAQTRETGAKVIGLCHGAHHGVAELARGLGLGESEVEWEAPGLNHVVYLTHFTYKGEDAYPLLDRWIENEAEEYWRTYEPDYNENQLSRAAIEQYRMVGLIPLGDTPRAGGWWFHSDDDTKRRWFGPLGGFDSELGWSRYIDKLEARREQMFEVVNDPSSSLTGVFPAEKSDEQMVPIIDALANGNAGRFQVNIPNNGLIYGLPNDMSVEVPAYVSARGVQGMRIGKLPDNLMLQVLLPRVVQAERSLGFAKNPNRGLMLQMILNDRGNFNNKPLPMVESYDEAVTLMDKFLSEDSELAALLGG
jgi:alpha-galactosidase